MQKLASDAVRMSGNRRINNQYNNLIISIFVFLGVFRLICGLFRHSSGKQNTCTSEMHATEWAFHAIIILSLVKLPVGVWS